MIGWEWLAVALVLWTALGVMGTLISLMRGERAKAWRGVQWIAGVWVVYLGTVLAVSAKQGQRVVAMGQEQCFDEMCFAVTGVEELPVYYGRGAMGGDAAGDGSRLLRVTVGIKNKGRGRAQGEGLIRAYLVDKGERQWDEVPGLSGVSLTAKVAAGGAIVSRPVFKVPADARGLGVVLTHGRGQPGALVIGDSDSLGHKPTVVWLGR